MPEHGCAPGHRRVVLEDLREINGELQNAERRPRSEIEQQRPGWEWGDITEQDLLWTETMETHRACADRGYRALLWLAERPESTIAVFGHGGIFKFMLSEHPKISADLELQRRFGNCELKAANMSLRQDPNGGSAIVVLESSRTG